MIPRKDENRTVYSTETGRVCPYCGKPVAQCSCKSKKAAPAASGPVRVRVESKGRRGKTVTTISGLGFSEDDLRELTVTLKRLCGAGGAVKDGIVEVQGDHAATVLAELKKRGISAKRAGG